MPRKKKSESSPELSVASPKPKKPRAVKEPKKAAAPKVKKSPKEPALKKSPLSKKKTPAEIPLASGTWKNIPRRGQTQMVAFVRDPHCIFTYWEVTPESVESAKSKLMEEYKDSSMVLRVFHTGEDGISELVYEIKVEPKDMNRYLELGKPSGTYFIEIAQKTISGKTVVYARSNTIYTSASLLAAPVSVPQGETPGEPSEEIWEQFYQELESQGIPSFPQGHSSAGVQKKSAVTTKKMGRYSSFRPV